MALETFLTPEEIANMLRVSRPWVYRLVQENRIPFFRIAGKLIRFNADEINLWMKENRGERYSRDKG
jgi:excisionase family DNA binding protein